MRLYRLDGGSGRQNAPVGVAYLKQRLSALLLSAEAPKSTRDDDEDVEAMLQA